MVTKCARFSKIKSKERSKCWYFLKEKNAEIIGCGVFRTLTFAQLFPGSLKLGSLYQFSYRTSSPLFCHFRTFGSSGVSLSPIHTSSKLSVVTKKSYRALLSASFRTSTMWAPSDLHKLLASCQLSLLLWHSLSQ